KALGQDNGRRLMNAVRLPEARGVRTVGAVVEAERIAVAFGRASHFSLDVSEIAGFFGRHPATAAAALIKQDQLDGFCRRGPDAPTNPAIGPCQGPTAAYLTGFHSLVSLCSSIPRSSGGESREHELWPLLYCLSQQVVGKPGRCA